MRQITKEETQELFNLVERHAIKYYDVQVEIVDHYASAIEEIWEKEPDLSFLAAQKRVYWEFWDFKTLEETKRQALEKQYKRVLWQGVKEWFSFPKVMLSLVLFLIVFQIISTNIFATNLLFQVIFYWTIFGSFYSLLRLVQLESKWKAKVLQFETLGTAISFPQVFGILAIQWTNTEWLFPMDMILSLAVVCWVLCQIIGHQLVKEQLVLIEKNYPSLLKS